MTRHVLLDNLQHRRLRVSGAHGAALGDAVMHAPTFPAEFRSVQAHYPIVFASDADGRVQPLALFGFERGQNLFLDGDRWDAHYLPLAMQRQPFLIGYGADGEPLVHIDLDHPRVDAPQGEALFHEHGGSTAFLERKASVLRALHEGVTATAAFVDALQAHGLLESFVLDVELDDGRKRRLAGFRTIAEERLQALDGAALERLQRAGHLEPAYMAIASQSCFRDLIERLRRREAGDA